MVFRIIIGLIFISFAFIIFYGVKEWKDEANDSMILSTEQYCRKYHSETKLFHLPAKCFEVLKNN